MPYITQHAQDKYQQDKTFLSEVSLGYVMPIERSVDIDTLHDFKIAEMLMKGV